MSQIRALVERRPFRAFALELGNGRRLRVSHPENIVLRGDLIIVFVNGDIAAICELPAITDLLLKRG